MSTINPTNEVVAFIPPVDPTDPASELSESPQARKQRELDAFILERTQAAQGRLISILERGVVGDRCVVPLPKHLYGEWVADDASEIARMEALGFVVDSVYATQSALHSDATGRAKVGDVIHMVTSRDNKIMIENLKDRVREQRHGRPGAKVQREESDFSNRVQKELPAAYVGASNAGTAHPAGVANIINAVTNQ